MRFLLKIAFPVLILLTLFLNTSLTQAQYYNDWVIPSFHSDIEIQEDGSVMVEETIVVDFTQEEHHGIFRDIQYRYTDEKGNDFDLKVNVKSVTDELGNPWNYETSYDGDYFNLKIGDADILINEIVTYKITYSFSRGINRFDENAELYWNVTGSFWPVSILKATANVTLPHSTDDLSKLRTRCITGALGSTYENCASEVVDGQTFRFATTTPLFSYEGLTIVAGFPRALVKEPSAAEKLWWWITEYIWFFIPFIVFFFLIMRWNKKGRDPEKRGTIIPYYKPPKGLTPSEVGAIVDEKVHIEDITAAIIDLAVRGYIKIKEIKGEGIFAKDDHELQLVKDYKGDKKLRNYEKDILEAIFNGSKKKKISALKNKFYKHLSDIKNDIYKTIVNQKYFPENPSHVRDSYYGAGAIILVGGIIISFFFQRAMGGIIFAAILSGIQFFIFGPFMPAKTAKGTHAMEQLLGLKMYIKTAEKDRVKFFEKDLAKEKKIRLYEQILPFALVLGVGKYWSKAFKDIYTQPPDWYSGDISTFNTMSLYKNLNTSTKAMASTFTSRPGGGAASGSSGFGGGGFSGGGFGGGGGGAW